MIRLEDLTRGQRIRGILPQQAVTIVSVEVIGDSAEVFYQRADGQAGTQLLFREHEARLALAEMERFWNLAAPAETLHLAAEAYRISLAHLFDSRLAVHTSLIEPLPHQITAVYGEMLPRQPLRFLLADDPGAGKTIMAGLLIRELIVRGDVQRCLICAPGGLVEQWQDELWEKFQLRFEILTRDRIEASFSGNLFTEEDRLIIRLDQVARNDALQEQLAGTEWDLIICDEAHKMSASFYGRELKETKRYGLGKLMRNITRHFLLMTATPHNGKEEDFHLFLALLDPDRFEGRPPANDEATDVSDLMRRMVKEKLLRFNGKPLFPPRLAYTVDYELSNEELALYEAVTEYVRTEFNRAEQLQNDGRMGTVGFALTVLQRRLASSPEAIYRSLHRRRLRLEEKRQAIRRDRRLAERLAQGDFTDGRNLDEVDWDEWEEYPDAEYEEAETELADSATAARTLAELEEEIAILHRLEQQANRVRHAGVDRKWEELAGLLQHKEMFTPAGARRKIVIFTEHRDTLDYLHGKLATLLGKPAAVVAIHGSVPRRQRAEVQDRFRNDPDVIVLLATDAAGEGINLQRAHLMVNYDLPWNPNRIEQRFGRIHRIGQENVCHLWNLVAAQTREGHVYQRLLQKIEAESRDLGGQVFDVLGELFHETPLRTLLVQAIRQGEQPEVRAFLDHTIDNATDRKRVRELLEQYQLVQDVMDLSEVERVRAEMERAAAQRLQPFYIKAFFMGAFALFGGRVHEREPGRYQINHVPAPIRDRARELGGRRQVLRQYERICFEKQLITQQERPDAEFICPGHIFLDTLIDLVRSRHGDLLQRGVVLIDPTDPGREPRALFFVEHAIHDARSAADERRRAISRVMRFVEVGADGQLHDAGSAPYLDYRAPSAEERAQLASMLDDGGLGKEAANRVRAHAISHLAPAHLAEVRARREALIDKTHEAVRRRLTHEINYWDQEARRYKEQEKAGKRNARLNWQQAQGRADRLYERLQRRERELEEERQLSTSPPAIVGRALIAPIGLLLGERTPQELLDRRITEQIAMQAVMQAEINLGNQPRDVSAQNLGYDIESRDGRTGKLRFIEVKGRRAGAETVTVTHNEMLRGLNLHEQYALALVEVEGGRAKAPRYVWNPPFREPDASEVSVNFDLQELLALASTESTFTY